MGEFIHIEKDPFLQKEIYHTTCDFDDNDDLFVFLDADLDIQLSMAEGGNQARIILQKDKAVALAHSILNAYGEE